MTSLTLLSLTVLLAVLTSVATANQQLGSICASDSACASGLHCLGQNGIKKCVAGQKLGSKCGPDPWWNCQPGLHCLGETDRKCVPGKPLGMECAADPWWSCQPGLYCLGSNGTKKCVPGKPVGMECGADPWWGCQPPLHCLGQDGEKKCVPGKPAGMPCAADPWWNCQPGLYCLGQNGVNKCAPGKNVGMECGPDPWWNCKPGLSCVSGKCYKPVGKGMPCAAKHVTCASALKCAGEGDKQYCVEPKKKGMACGWDAYWTCEHGLSCENNVCV